MEMWNVLLEIGGRAVHIIKWQRTWCSSVLWKIELLSNETGYLAEKMSMQSVEGAIWLLLTAIMVKYERREKLEKELLSKKTQGFVDLENSQRSHISKSEKVHSEKEF